MSAEKSKESYSKGALGWLVIVATAFLVGMVLALLSFAIIFSSSSNFTR